MEEATLEDILSGEASAAADVAEQLDSEEVTTGETAEGEAEAEPEASEQSEDEPPSSEPEKPPEGFVPQAALSDERGKRQDLQRQLDELRGELRASVTPQEEQPEAKVDFLDDPDAYMAQREQAWESKLQETQDNASRMVLSALEAAAKTRHDDYDQMAMAFAQVAQGNVALQQEAAAAPDPAEFVYQAGKRLALLQSADGDLETLIAKKQEEAVANYLKQNPTGGQKAASVPESLTTVPGATERGDKAPVETPLNQLFKSLV